MRSFLAVCFALFIISEGSAQKKANQSYPSLLWEITGNGLTQPSYLFGTMHVSNKLAFHLSDSFYNAIASCSTVSLELDPKQWQPEMFRVQQSQMAMQLYSRPVNDFMRESSFRFNSNYEDNIKMALREEPYIINGLLYRTGEGQSDFQENTYLDLYVYQTARKLGKKATGVENYLVSEKIQLEAQEDMIKDRARNNRMNFNFENPYEIQRKIQEAYRRGDLGQLDSLSQLTGNSEAFNEKFLYGRNDIQANAIDSIIRKESLFVAVGAAHLPGQRGIIEILRRKGYTLRPVNMTDRDSDQREKIDKIRIPVTMQPFNSTDGFISLQIPGSFFKRTELPFNESWQYADMENGTYYTFSRIRVQQGLPGETEKTTARKTDSLLYENIPGKILQKKTISLNGYSGFDITNKTRRGDIQRYNIFFTPKEILIFKISGVDEYVNGTEANHFFSSIQLHEKTKQQWATYTPQSGGFTVSLPHIPQLKLGKQADDFLDNIQFEATDADNGDNYMIWQKSLHNYNFLEEDTLDISLMEESLKSSDIVEKELSRKFNKQDGFACLDMQFSLKDGGVLKARAFINGAHYYLLTGKSKDAKTNFNKFFNSFHTSSYRYGTGAMYTDKSLGFTVQTPVQPAIDTDLRDFLNRRQYNAMELMMGDRYQPRYIPRYAFFKSDSTGEAILVTANTFPKYYYQKDTARFWENELGLKRLREDFIVDNLIFSNGPDSSLQCTYSLLDTNTNRKIKVLALQRSNMLYKVTTLIDNGATESSFTKDFFTSFRPVTEAGKPSVFTNKVTQLLNDLASKDSVIEKIAKEAITWINWTGADFPSIKKAFETVNPAGKDYLLTKTKFIQVVGAIKDSVNESERVNWLAGIYNTYADTGTYQNAAIRSLASTKTKKSYTTLKEILVQSPAIFDNTGDYLNLFRLLSDSLLLASQLYPDILQLTSFDDYKQPVINLLVKLVDSGHIQQDVYASQFSKLFFDAQIQLRKLQGINEREIMRSQADNERADAGFPNNQLMGLPGNNLLTGYLTLLMPYYGQNVQVTRLFEKALQSSDLQVRMVVASLLAKNNKPVNDTVWVSIAANDQQRAPLFDRLEKIKRSDLFPAKYKTQEAMGKSLMTSNSRGFLKPVDIQVAGKKLVEIKKTKGYIYFFKYKIQKQGDWLMALCGLQPEDSSNVNTDRTILSVNAKKLIADGKEEEQFDKLAKQAVMQKRKSAVLFYSRQNSFGGGLLEF